MPDQKSKKSQGEKVISLVSKAPSDKEKPKLKILSADETGTPKTKPKRKRRKKLIPEELGSDEERIDGIIYRKPLYGHIMEEVDPTLGQDTFCVITRKFQKHYICRFSASKSLYLFAPLNPLRKLAIFIVTHRYFDSLIIFTILCNCITLATSVNEFDEKGNKIRSKWDIETDYLEYIFLAIYCAEMILKIISKGFILNKYSYLRNSWNMVDFIVVCSGITTTIIAILSDGETEEHIGEDNASSNLQLLRIFRVLRAVKTVSVLPGLRTMINALLSSAIQLLEVMALNFFCLVIFSLFALEIYMGKLRQKCVVIQNDIADPGIESSIYPNDVDRNWYTWINDPRHWAPRDPAYPKEEPQPCGNDTTMRSCSLGYVCLNVGENPDDGWTSFDNLFLSMLTTFQLLTTDFWERPYELVLSTVGPWSIIFFLVVLFFGSFYLLNLMLAVVALSYETEVGKKTLGSLTKNEKLFRNRASSTFSFDEPHRLTTNMIIVYRRHTAEERKASLDKSTARKGDQLSGFFGLPNEPRKSKSLGEAILGLLGRKLTLDGELRKIDHRSPVLVNAVAPELDQADKTVAIEIDPRRPVKDDQSDQGSTAESQSVCSRADLSNNYPHSNTLKRRTDEHIRLTALILRKKLKPIVNHATFDIFMTICIVVNTLFFAMEHHGQSENMKNILELGNHFFLAVFTAECVLKLLALQKEYFVIGWNTFDIIIVIISLLDVIASNLFTDLGFVRSLRLLRIFKLAQSWITMKVLLNIIFSTFSALGNLTLLLGIVIYIFAVLGMQVVGGEYTPQAFDSLYNFEMFPRWNWQNFWYAFMMVFRIICGEWIESMWECFDAQKPQHTQYKCFLIYFPTLIVGNFIVLNLFLALLLDSFNTEDLKAARNKEMETSGKAHSLKKIAVLLMLKRGGTNKDGEGATRANSTTKASASTTTLQRTKTGISLAAPMESLARIRFKLAAKKIMIKNRVALAEKRIEEVTAASSKVVDKRRTSFGLVHDVASMRSIESETKILGNCIPKQCMNLNCTFCKKLRRLDWTKWDHMRSRAARIVGHPIFEWTILAFIFLSSITLCFEDIHLDNSPNLKETLFILNIIFCIIFVLEMILKWFAFGLWGYITNSWCVLDAIIVVISLVTLYFDIRLRIEFPQGTRKSRGSNFAALKALRTLRALRPLRAISRWEGMKIVVNALMYAIPLIFNVFLVCLLFWLVFSIMGVQLYKGKFFKCVNADGDRVSHLLAPNKQMCCAKAETHQYSWINVIPTFDNVLEGYLSLFQIATFEGWIELMAAAIDAVGVDQQPKNENEPLHYLFFVIFIVFGGFFTLNLFIGVMVDNFGMLKKKYEGSLVEILLTKSQRQYYTALKKLGQVKPRKIINRPENNFLSVFYDLVVSRKFEIGVFIMIFLNMALISFETFSQSVLITDTFSALNAFFAAIYILESVVKLLGLRQYYFTVAWNVFDFILVLASMVDIMMGDLSVDFPIPPTMLRVVRVFRIGRILRLVKAAKGIRKLLYALVVSMPALGNIGALIALTTFIYAILGMASFSGVAKYGAVDQVVNWDTFLNSCIVLLRLMLAAGWNDVLDGLLPAPVTCGTYRKSSCGLEGEPECPIKWIIVGYFVTYILIVFLIIINMYTAIILENYVEASQEEEGGIIEDDLEMFYIRWSRFDPQATQFIAFEELGDLIAGLEPPLCVPKPNLVAIVAFNLPICRGYKIHCLDVLHALVKHVLGHIDEGDEFRKLQEKMERKFQKQFPTRKLLDIISTTRIWKIQQNAAIVIQRAWRAYYKRTHPEGNLLAKDNKSEGRPPSLKTNAAAVKGPNLQGNKTDGKSNSINRK